MAKKFTRRTISDEKVQKVEQMAEEMHGQEKKETPKTTNKKERVSFNLRMPRHIYEQLTAEKEATGMTRSAIIYQALAQYFSKK